MTAELEAADRELVERVARRIVALRLEVPALLTLETCRPLSVVAGQALAFFQPFAQALLPWPGYERFAALIERRVVVDLLARLVEDGAAARRRKQGRS
jgi:hypothetical protein